MTKNDNNRKKEETRKRQEIRNYAFKRKLRGSLGRDGAIEDLIANMGFNLIDIIGEESANTENIIVRLHKITNIAKPYVRRALVEQTLVIFDNSIEKLYAHTNGGERKIRGLEGYFGIDAVHKAWKKAKNIPDVIRVQLPQVRSIIERNMLVPYGLKI